MLQRKYGEIVDRQKYVEERLFGIINDEDNSINAVVLYGQSGIGKSSISKSLRTKITQHLSNSTVAVLGEENLNNCVRANPVNAILLKLRNKLLKDNSDLSCFDIAYLLYGALANNSTDVDLSTKVIQKSQVLQIIEIVKKGLYQFPLLLEATKCLGNYQSQQKWQPEFDGSQIYAALSWFFIQQNQEIRQWWKLKGSQNLQELKDCASLSDILKLLPLFLGRDLQAHFQNTQQKAVVFIDNYEYLNTYQENHNWLKDIIPLIPSILWVIFAEKTVDATTNTQHIPIPNLTNAESQVIIQKLGVENDEIAQQIIQASEGIPLYLHLGIETYLNLTKQKAAQVKNIASNISEILPKLSATWDWYERRIWQVLSNCRSWDEVLFAKLMSQFDIASCDWICDCWDKLLHRVVKSPFVESNPEGWSLHPIVGEYLHRNQPDNLQQSVNNWLFEYNQAEYQQSELQLSALIKLLEYGLKSRQQQKVVSWFLAKVKLQQKAGKHDFTVFALKILLRYQNNALAFSLLGESLYALGDYQQAVTALQTAQKLWEAEKLQDSLAFSNVQLQLAACYVKLQCTSDANDAAKKALAIRTTQLNQNSLEIAEVLNLQALIAVIEGFHVRALELTQQALQIFASHQNVEIKLAQTKFTLGWLNAIAKNYHAAEKLFKQVLNDIADENHPLAIYCHGMLGNIYQNIGYFAYHQAYEEYNKSLEIAEINFGLTHPRTLQLIAAIINFSRIRGEYDTVDILTQRRHANMEISNFEENPAVADRLNKIGCLLLQQGKYAFSEHLLQQALQINCRYLSQQHPQTAETFHNLGLIYKNQKRYYTAEVYFKQALQIRCATFGKKHPITANSINSLAALYCCMEKYQQAEPLLQQALEICYKNFGEMHPHTATTLNNLAQMYQCLGLSKKAEPIFHQALDICQQVLGDNHVYTKIVESNLSRLQEKN
ncbi:tetratricopeptide repeat protein [Rivularia sp. PCC 7116]|uniref:tetratricopeptide repeat protein n=1 Tax=Rivularia sp. PCC 7116 TaxID=373994 RepID=UPI00029F393F|nr:tetratricopeptide repeat protein [Rivularia sp. PCC 7116]AFY52795.1 tetratricopeptide repeat protein [Rivularia sp. PCC 7116]